MPHLMFVDANDSTHPDWLLDHPMPKVPAGGMPLQFVHVTLYILFATYSSTWNYALALNWWPRLWAA